MVAGLLNPQQNGDDSQTPPPTPRSSSARNDDSDDSQPPDQPGPPGSALAIRNAISQSQTPVKPPKKDTTPTQDKVPEKDIMFVENEVKTEPGTPRGQVNTNSPQDARGACSIDEERPGDTFYSTDEASSLNLRPRNEPEEVRDIETGEGKSNASVENVAKPVRRTRRNTPKNTEKSAGARLAKPSPSLLWPSIPPPSRYPASPTTTHGSTIWTPGLPSARFPCGGILVTPISTVY